MRHLNGLRAVGVWVVWVAASVATLAGQSEVRHTVGALHGFLTIHSQTGATLGYGELSEFATGDIVTVRMIYHFHDGSLDDETTVFTQRKAFEFVSDHHVQQGRFFPKPCDITVKANGEVTTRTVGKDGKAKVETEKMDLPPNLANGMEGTIVSNQAANAQEFKLGLVVPDGKGRLLKLDIGRSGTQPFHIAGTLQKATVYRLKVDIGGLAGVIAPMVGKQPADTLLWVLEGEIPVIVRIVGPLGEGTPIVSIELAGASFAKDSVPAKK